jgi:putative aldouronate transport system permease protein
MAKKNDKGIVPNAKQLTRLQIDAKAVLKDWQLYSLLLLPVLNFLIFKYGPMVGNIIAFNRYTPGGFWLGSKWVGIRYFKMFMLDPNFWRIVRNTVVISFTSLALGFPAPIVFALLLNELKGKHFKKTVQTISYLPHFLSMIVVAGMIQDILSPSGSGFINIIIKAITGTPVYFFQEPKYFVPIYVISGIWQGVGFGAIIYLAALTGINPELYEAAEIDGANRLQQTIHVTLPGILPTVIVLLILNVGNILNVGFEKVFLLQNPVIYDVADVISTYLYRIGLQANNPSYATAIGLFESIIGVGIVIGANQLSKKVAQTSLW